MQIVWDEPKRLANMAQHEGLDFADLTPAFFEAATVIGAKKGRLMALGELEDGHTLAVVFVPLGREALSVISMRRADRKERRQR